MEKIRLCESNLIAQINSQIDVIKITLREKNSRTHVTSEMITSDATALIIPVVNAPILLTHISNSSSNFKGISPGNSFKAEVNIPSKSPTTSGKKSKAPSKRTQNDQLISFKKNLPKKMCEDVMNSVINQINVSKLEVNFSIDREGEHQMDCYQIFGSGICLICAKKHWYLEGKWWIDSQGNKKYYLICDNIKEPGIPVDEELGVYSENTVLNQPIPWSYALRFPDKSIAVEA